MHSSTTNYLRPTFEQIELMKGVRFSIKEAIEKVQRMVPEGRYQSLALTALEQAAMWANKGITRNSDGSPRDGAIEEPLEP